MLLLEKSLKIKKSTLPGAGKGLFTKVNIAKGERIVEYKGKIKINKKIADSRYAFFVKPNYAIDAMNYKEGIAQYANDATGTGQLKYVKNNCMYSREGLRVYIKAITNIKAGAELLVFYGKGYWIADDEVEEKTNSKKTKTKPKATVKKAVKKILKKVAPKKAVKKPLPGKAAKKTNTQSAPKKSLKK